MTGTGTQTDPFRPTNWSEFVTAIGQSGVYIECPENGIWDMDEMLPEGIRSSILWYDNTVHGNGMTINNLYLNGGYFNFYKPSGSSIHNIEKLNFLNLATSGSNEKMFLISSSGYNVQFKNCKFSGLISSGCVFNSSGGSSSYMYLTHDGEKSCSLNFKIMGNGRLHNGSPYCRYCNIKLDGETAAQDSSGHTTYEKCYISGTSPYNYLQIYGYDNILDIEIPEGKKIASSSSGHMNTSVINIDKMHGEYSDTRYKYIEATTEQLSDAAYLQSKGFSIAG